MFGRHCTGTGPRSWGLDTLWLLPLFHTVQAHHKKYQASRHTANVWLSAVRADMHRMQGSAACACRLADDKQRLLRQSYDEGAQISHLQKLLEASEGRNGALVEQTESAKARKVAAERRMLALDLHVERVEEKMTMHCGKQNQQLQVRRLSLAAVGVRVHTRSPVRRLGVHVARAYTTCSAADYRYL